MQVKLVILKLVLGQHTSSRLRIVLSTPRFDRIGFVTRSRLWNGWCLTVCKLCQFCSRIDPVPSASMATQAGHDSAFSASPARDDDEMFDSSTYECNICYEVAREPVVTMCGHLYCWPCLYRYVNVCSYICILQRCSLDFGCLTDGCKYRTCVKSVLSAKLE